MTSYSLQDSLKDSNSEQLKVLHLEILMAQLKALEKVMLYSEQATYLVNRREKVKVLHSAILMEQSKALEKETSCSEQDSSKETNSVMSYS